MPSHRFGVPLPQRVGGFHSPRRNSRTLGEWRQNVLLLQQLKQRWNQPSPLPSQPPQRPQHSGSAPCHQEICQLSWLTGNGTQAAVPTCPEKESSAREWELWGQIQSDFSRCHSAAWRHSYSTIAMMVEVTSCFWQPPTAVPSTAFLGFPASTWKFINHILASFQILLGQAAWNYCLEHGGSQVGGSSRATHCKP